MIVDFYEHFKVLNKYNNLMRSNKLHQNSKHFVFHENIEIVILHCKSGFLACEARL